MSMDRREAIKAGAAALAFASGANAAEFTPTPPTSSKRLEQLSLEWNQQRSNGWFSSNEARNKWRIVDQMIEEHGDGEE